MTQLFVSYSRLWFVTVRLTVFCLGHDPENYLTYFKRATAYLSLGRNNAAVDDFSKILDLKPDFDQVLLQRARIYVKEGSFSLAILDLEKYISNHPQHEESIRLVMIDTKNTTLSR